MKWIHLNKEWKFTYKGNQERYQGVNKRVVDLPHDFSIETERTEDAPSGFAGAFYQGGVGIYEKTICIEKKEGQRVLLVMDGAYMLTEVFMNGNLASFHPNGYTTNQTDLTPWIKEGENELRIVVSNDAMPNSRWYTGSGIYRDVWLVTGSAFGLLPQNIAVETVSASQSEAVLRIRTQLPKAWKMGMKGTLRTEIIGTDFVKEQSICDAKGEIIQEIILPEPDLWDVKRPHLSKLRQTIVRENGEEDSCEVTFGIRTISFDATKGFCLNGQSMKLKGGCVHHDNGIIGSCSFYDAEYRKVKRLKELGYNALRMAHNPASETLLQVCDELGMLVMDELYDQWTIKKNLHDYHLFFRDWWQRDVKTVIEGHRNHPSVIMWSTGNEIVERDGNSDGNEWARRLAQEIRKYDTTRGVTNGICAVFMENGEFGGVLGNIFNGSAGDIEDIEVDFPGVKEEYQKVMDNFENLTEKFAEPLDVVGYNYLERFYERGHEKYPDRVICGTESYPKTMQSVWEKVEQLSYVIGDFTWTACDYLGESGIGRAVYGEKRLPGLFGEFPYHVGGCGDLDIIGNRKPQAEYRRRLWTKENLPYIMVERPQHHGKKEILSPWGWEQGVCGFDCPGYEGKPIKVTVYSAAQEIALFLNGKEVGRKKAMSRLREEHFEIIYQPGELTAVVYEDGVESGRSSLQTPQKNIQIKAQREADLPEKELIYVRLTVEDEEGNCKTSCNAAVRVNVEGAAELLALGNGNPEGMDAYHTGESAFYDGRALLVLRKKGSGNIRILAEADQMEKLALEMEC